MDVREKLVGLLNKANSACVGTDCFEGCKFYAENDCLYKLMADVMIAHGVTIQEWISVKDRLPDEECRCLVIDAAGDIEMDCYDGKGRFVLDRSGAVQHPSHWMPLPKMPQPPKGE